MGDVDSVPLADIFEELIHCQVCIFVGERLLLVSYLGDGTILRHTPSLSIELLTMLVVVLCTHFLLRGDCTVEGIGCVGCFNFSPLNLCTI